MADETKTDVQDLEQPDQAETDWQAKYEEMREHMRDWEKKAKANQSAAEELEKLKAAQMTEQEKVIAEKDAALAELAALKSEKERSDAAQRISAETGVPLELLLYCSDEDAMADFAKKYEKEQPVTHAAASASRSRIVREGEKSHGDIFADAVADLF